MNPHPRTASTPDLILEPVAHPEILAVTASARPRPPLSPQRAARRGQLKLQLTDPFILAEDAEQLTYEANKIRSSFVPRTAWQDILVAAIATLQFRICRADRIERKLRDLASFRAIDLWAEDQALAVENLAIKLPKRPGQVVAQLRDTPAGIDWLIARWEHLARIKPGAWTEPERDFACLLLGGNLGIDPTEAGFAQARIADLRDLYSRVEETDTMIRGLVEADLCDDRVPGLAKLRRDRKALFLQMKWYIDQFHVEHPDRWDDPMRQPGHISYDLKAKQDQRRSTWSFAEPKASAESNPTTTDTNDETKPSAPAPSSNPPMTKTKPPAMDLVPRAGATLMPTGELPTATIQVSASRGPIHDYATERGRNHSRPLRPGEMPRGHARRLKAARRQTNLQILRNQLGGEIPKQSQSQDRSETAQRRSTHRIDD